MIHSSYNQEEKILYMNRTDEIKMQDLFALVQDTVSNYKDIKCLYIIDDARNSSPQFSSRDYPELSKRVSDGLTHFMEVRHAIIVDSPMNTALGILFEGMTKEIPSYSFKTFFSEEDGLKWLKQGDHICE
jgi:hypothetical protein